MKIPKIFRKIVKQFYSRSGLQGLIKSSRFRIMSQMRWEIKAVHAGIQKFHRAPNLYSLRRNIHRLEKGLSYKGIFRLFAIHYIDNTVNTLIYLKNENKIDPNELAYFEKIVHAYFTVCSHDTRIEKAERKFIESSDAAMYSESSLIKLSMSSSNNIPNFTQFLALCKKRRAIRYFLPNPLPDDIIENAFRAALLAPSACNRQPIRYILIRKKDILKFKNILVGANTFFDNVPVLLFLIGDLSAYEESYDRHLIYIDGGLSAMIFVLTLESLGAASCILNCPDIPKLNLQLRKLLNLYDHEAVVMAIACGYPDPDQLLPISSRKKINKLWSIYDN